MVWCGVVWSVGLAVATEGDDLDRGSAADAEDLAGEARLAELNEFAAAERATAAIPWPSERTELSQFFDYIFHPKP